MEEHQSIVKLDQATQMLAEISTVDDAKDLVDLAEAARVYAKQVDLGLEAQNHAAEIKLRAQRKAGELLDDMDKNKGAATEGWKTRSQPSTTLDDIGITKNQSSQWQQIADMPDVDFEDYIEQTREKDEEITTAGIVREAKRINNPDWYQSSKTDEWATPQWLFDLLDDEFGFSLDVCASPDNHKCDKYFTRDDDSFSQEWAGTCWMNPPYGKSGGTDIYDWMAKAKQSAKNGTIVVCLVPARTDTNWWWDNVIGSEIRFLKGRIKYKTGTMSPFPSAVIIMGYDAKVRWWDVRE